MQIYFHSAVGSANSGLFCTIHRHKQRRRGHTLAETMVGIGPKKAAAIVAYRDTHGPFKSVDEILAVKGIGPATLEKNRDNIRVVVEPKKE